MKFVLGFIVVIVLISGVAVVELYSQIGRYQAYWRRQNAEKHSTDELLYIALGDSTAQGIGASRAHKGYVGRIAKELAEQSGQGVRVVNLSKTGAKISDALDRQLPLAKKQAIDDRTIVTIEIGANDMNSFDSKRFEQQMDQLMSQLPRQTIISDMPYFGGGRHKNNEVNAVQANTIIHRLAQSHGLKVANLHDILKQNDSWRIYALDRFHPSSYGYQLWAKAFLDQL